MEILKSIFQILEHHLESFINAIPLIFLSVVILLIAFGFSKLASSMTRALMKRKFQKSLLIDVVARTVGTVIFLLGVYLIFEMANLTGIALTIISGTGLFGIILGIAFRDIAENFLASILLSIHHPFQNGDLVEIVGITGYVQGISMRVTFLTTLEGHLVQIPNATVYKSQVRNYSTNPHRREEFTIILRYDETFLRAQEVILNVLKEHSSILKYPEPSVLIDSIDKSNAFIKVCFWVDSNLYQWLEVKSSVIYLVKKALNSANIAIPDSSYKIICPEGVKVLMQ